jgi:3-oxoacyl-[acyl-carrier-protein] synthase-3
MRDGEPDSAWWGDGASAVVFGPVSDGKGLLGSVHNANGASCEALVLGVPGKRWWEDGSITLTSVDRTHTRAMLLSLVDRAGDAIAESMSRASVAAAEVDFYASHQGTAWLPRVTAQHAGLGHAKTIATFPSFGNLNSANIPLILAIAEREGMIRDGSVVVTFAGGLGETWSSLCLRWGR